MLFQKREESSTSRSESPEHSTSIQKKDPSKFPSNTFSQKSIPRHSMTTSMRNSEGESEYEINDNADDHYTRIFSYYPSADTMSVSIDPDGYSDFLDCDSYEREYGGGEVDFGQSTSEFLQEESSLPAENIPYASNKRVSFALQEDFNEIDDSDLFTSEMYPDQQTALADAYEEIYDGSETIYQESNQTPQYEEYPGFWNPKQREQTVAAEEYNGDLAEDSFQEINAYEHDGGHNQPLVMCRGDPVGHGENSREMVARKVVYERKYQYNDASYGVVDDSNDDTLSQTEHSEDVQKVFAHKLSSSSIIYEQVIYEKGRYMYQEAPHRKANLQQRSETPITSGNPFITGRPENTPLALHNTADYQLPDFTQGISKKETPAEFPVAAGHPVYIQGRPTSSHNM